VTNSNYKLFPDIGLCQGPESISRRSGEKSLREFLSIRADRVRFFLTFLGERRTAIPNTAPEAEALLAKMSKFIDKNTRAVALKTVRMSINADKLEFVTANFIKRLLGPNPKEPDRRTESYYYDIAIVFAEILRAEHGHLVWGSARAKGMVEENHIGLIPVDARGRRRDSEALIPWPRIRNCAWRAYRDGKKADFVSFYRMISKELARTK
jgi:hypothetical protein